MAIDGLGAKGPQGLRGRGGDDDVIKKLKAEFEANQKARSLFDQLDATGDNKIDKDDEAQIGTSTLSALQMAVGSESITFDRFKKFFTQNSFPEFVSGLITARKAELKDAAQSNEKVYGSFDDAKAAAKEAAGPEFEGGTGTANYVDSEGNMHRVTYWYVVNGTPGDNMSTTGHVGDMNIGK